MLQPVSLGLACGAALIVILSLAMSATSPKGPVMLLTTADGKSFRASINQYCDGQCDILAYVRIVPSDPPIHIDKQQGLRLRIEKSFEQPRTIRFYLPDLDSGTTVGFDPAKREDGKYFIPSALGSGDYILDVLAFWNSSQEQEHMISLHRFKVVIE